MREDDRRRESRGHPPQRRLRIYTEEIRDAEKQRIGFRVVTLDGKQGELADKYSVHGPRVGSYRVNVESFERVALPSLEMEKGRILIIDEIGKMECFSEPFVRRVREIFQAGYPVLATIPLRGGEFLEEIRRQRDVITFIVTTVVLQLPARPCLGE